VVTPTTPEAAPAAPAKTPCLKASDRNKIVSDYKAGTLHPDYEIVTTKIEGKYIVKPRKNHLTEEQIQKTKPKVNEQPPTILPSVAAPQKSHVPRGRGPNPSTAKLPNAARNEAFKEKD
jgi:hypothetical protein